MDGGRLVPAGALEVSALRELFNEGFSDYLVPLRMDEAAFGAHLDANDIDLACSRVVVDDRPAAFALIARRDGAAWVGGMGTVPASRRQGLGERALVSGLDAARDCGCRDAWLEVLDANHGAIRLYEKLGFDAVRELIVWSLPPATGPLPHHGSVEAGRAQAWIASHRHSREPWQRADESVASIGRGGASLRGLVVEDAGQIAGAAAGRELHLANAPAGEPASRALERLGARVVARQHEMRLDLADSTVSRR